MNWGRTLANTAAKTALAAAIALPMSFGTTATASAETTLRVVMHSDLKIVDPIWTTAYMSRNYGYMVYDTLFSMDSETKVHPQMVDTYSVSDDKLTYTMTLRDGLKWHDGAPVTAEDCIASIKRWGSKDSMGQKLLEFVDSFTAVDDKTFEIKLKKPYGLVVASLAKPSSNVPFMMPKRVAETPASEQISDYTGSGPFVFKQDEWKPGDVAVFEKFDDYVPRSEEPSWAAGGKVVNVDRVEWISIKDHQTAVNALLEGEVDYLEAPPTDLLPLFEGNDEITAKILNPLGNQYMFRLNWLHPPFDNVEIRRAALAAINQVDFVQATIGNPEYYKECPAMFVCGTAFASDAGTEIVMKSDIEGAKKMLADAGYDGTPVVVMQSTDVDVLNNLGPVAADKLKQAGFNVDLQAMDWQTLVARRAKKDPPSEGGWNVFMTSWTAADILNPISAAGYNAGCDTAWFGWPCDEKMEELREAFATETDEAKQKELAVQIQERAMEVVTHAHAGQWYQVPAWRSDKLTGVLGGPFPIFWNIAKSE